MSAALQSCEQVHCVFVFDTAILNALPRADRRMESIHDSLVEVDASLRELSGKVDAGMIVLHGSAVHEITALAKTLNVQAVFCARDYERQAIERDAEVRAALAAVGKQLVQMKDHVVFEEQEALTQAAKPMELQSAGLTLGRDYPLPIVDHAAAREKTLQRYGAVRRVA